MKTFENGDQRDDAIVEALARLLVADQRRCEQALETLRMADSPSRTIFDPTSLQKHVEAALSSLTVPDGKRGVIVGYVRRDGSAGVAALWRIGKEGWQLGANFHRDLEEGIAGELVVKGVF